MILPSEFAYIEKNQYLCTTKQHKQHLNANIFTTNFILMKRLFSLFAAGAMSLTTSDYVLDTRDGITAFYRYQAGDDASACCDVFRAVIHPETTTADVIYLQLPGPWGDVNGDDRVSVGDVATLVGHLKGNTPQPFVKGNADADKNGLIDKQDVEAVRNLIIKRVNP